MRFALQLLICMTLLCLVACKRDRPVPPSGSFTPIDGRVKFVGVYDVYDTMSNWKYEMEISLYPGTIIDSLYISNWGGSFDVYCQQDKADQSNLLDFGFYFGIEDHQGNRWALFEEFDSLFMHSRLINDTLRLSYLKDNIAFYVADGVPYFRQSYREFAVKRDGE